MDQIFDRLGNLLKSLFQNDDDPAKTWEWRGKTGDPDLDAAWDELNDYLRSDEESARANRANARTGSSYGSRYSGTSRPRSSQSTIPDEVRKDYGNLEVPVGSDMATVRQAYHRLIRQYHPDRFANNPTKLRQATEIAQRINQSYQRIKRYNETGRV